MCKTLVVVHRAHVDKIDCLNEKAYQASNTYFSSGYHAHAVNTPFYTVKLGYAGVNNCFSYISRRGGSDEYPQSMFWS